MQKKTRRLENTIRSNKLKRLKKYLLLGFILGVFIIGIVIVFKGQQASSVDKDLSVVRVTVEGMTCEECEGSIKKVVKKLRGIYKLEMNHEAGTGYIQFDHKKVSEADILAQINEAGYIAQKRKPSKLKVLNYNVQFQAHQ
jgi:copper chaperone CopZ